MPPCRRCGHALTAADVACPLCYAPGPAAPPRLPATVVYGPPGPGRTIGVAFVLLLLTNVALFWYVGTLDEDALSTEPNVRRMATAWSIVAAIDTVLVLVTWLLVRKHLPSPPPPAGKAARTWLVAPLLLAALLGLNVLYHWSLLELAGVEPEADVILGSGHHTAWLLVLFCVQPALIEELFFRRLALDFFLPYTTAGSAIFASSAMFAAVHTGALMSFPLLLLIGAVLGWLRLRTGSLVLPILVHFLHNLAVSLHELATA